MDLPVVVYYTAANAVKTSPTRKISVREPGMRDKGLII